MVKEREFVIPPIAPWVFPIPVERQLSAGDVTVMKLPPVSVVEPPKPAPINRTALLKDMKAIVYALLGEQPKRGRPDRGTQYALILLAPIFLPLDALKISNVIGAKFLIVKQALARMEEARICFKEEGGVRFTGDWLPLFAEGREKILENDKEFGLISTAFILDSLVIAGEVTRRTNDDGEFLYVHVKHTAQAA